MDCTTCIAKRRMDGGVHLLNLSTQTLDLWGVGGWLFTKRRLVGELVSSPSSRRVHWIFMHACATACVTEANAGVGFPRKTKQGRRLDQWRIRT